MRKAEHDGFAVALAWPETYCKQAGAWYDGLTTYLGFTRQGYYRVGHAALLLIGYSGEVEYFDFGRYQAPHGQGRVRHRAHDPELELRLSADIKDGRLLNLTSLLEGVHGRAETHGEGYVLGGACSVDLQASRAYVNALVKRQFVPYGPFLRGGSNCSRFVRDAILAGRPAPRTTLLLRTPLFGTPSPAGVVSALPLRAKIGSAALPKRTLRLFQEAIRLPKLLPRPELPPNLPPNAKWLSGEGAGSWFVISRKGTKTLNVKAHEPKGKRLWETAFEIPEAMQGLPLADMRPSYPCHYGAVTLSHRGKTFRISTKFTQYHEIPRESSFV